MSGHLAPIKIYGLASGSGFVSGVASIDIPEDGEILAVVGHVSASGMDALNDQAIAELSFLSTHQIEQNDSRGSILEVSVMQAFLTTGGGNASQTTLLTLNPGWGIRVNAGERIHLHTYGSTGVTPKATFMLYLSAGAPRRSQRRR